MSQLFPVSKDEKIAELKREIEMRIRVFSRKVAEGSLSPGSAERRLDIMKAVLKDYEEGRVR